MRAACRAAIRKIKTRRFKIERGEVIRRFSMNGEGREWPLPAQQCHRKTHKPRCIRARFGQHIIIACHQRHAQAGFDLPGMKAARLHRQAIRAAPGGKRNIRHEKRKGSGGGFSTAGFCLPRRDHIKPRRGIAQQISKRQRMTREAIGCAALQFRTTFPQHAPALFADILRHPLIQSLARTPAFAERDQIAFGKPHQAKLQFLDIHRRHTKARRLTAWQDESTVFKDNARTAIRHGDGQRRIGAEVTAFARQASAQDQACGLAPGQAAHAKLICFAFDGEVRQGRVSAHPIFRAPITAPRGRDGEGDAGARRFGIRLRRDAPHQHACGATCHIKRFLVARIIGQAFHHRFKSLHLLREAILPAERFGNQQQGRNLGLSARGELKGAPGGLQSAVILGRRAGKLCFSQRQPMIGIAIAKPDAFFQGNGSGGEITPRGGILRAAFGSGALLRRATGREAPLQALLIGAGFLGQAGQLKALRPGKGRG